MVVNQDGLFRMPAYQDTHLAVDFGHESVLLDGAPVRLTRKEYALLALLTSNAGDIVRRDVLLKQVWGYCDGIRTRTLDVHIRRLRKKLDPFSGEYIETIFGVGYRFQPYRSRTKFDVAQIPMTATA
jgi:DNA-binding response OmpR family regulator